MDYDTARKNLLAFRQAILNDMVSGRLNAGLDAGHDSMVKFQSKIDGLGVVPYLFGRVQEYATALKLHNLDLGTGEIRRIQGSWTGAKTLYPQTPPFNVPQRELPQVDQFTYTPSTPLEKLNASNENSLRSAFIVQVPSGTFRDAPDAEDATYDYYQMFPCTRHRGRYEFVTKQIGFTDWGFMRAEVVMMYRDFVKADTWTKYQYNIDVFLDCAIDDGTNIKDNVPYLFWFMRPTDGAPNVTYITGTLRMPYPYKGVWLPKPADWFSLVSGFSYVSLGYGVVDYASVYLNTFKIDLGVKDNIGGTTSPAPAVYVKNAFSSMVVQAFPNSGYIFDHWESEGATISIANPYTFTVYRPHTIRAVFRTP